MSEDDRPGKAPTRLLVEGGPEVAKRARKVLGSAGVEPPAPFQQEANAASVRAIDTYLARTEPHPAPWRWFKNDGKPAWSLEDAGGIAVVEAMSVRSEVQPLIAAAPEMEALLRRLVAAQASFETIVILRKDAPALLARIDAAKGGE